MKSCFAAMVFAFVSSVVFAGDTGAAQSAAAVTPESAAICVNGVCQAETRHRSSCRNGFCGRTVERTRTATRAVIEVPVNVVVAPARVIRAGRVCRGNRCW